MSQPNVNSMSTEPHLNVKPDIDEILLNHRSDVLRINRGVSNGKDVGTSAQEAKQAIYSLLASEAVDVEHWTSETVAELIEAVPLSVIKAIMEIKE